MEGQRAYDEGAAYRLRTALGPLPGLTEKKRFGGVSLMGAAWSERPASRN